MVLAFALFVTGCFGGEKEEASPVVPAQGSGTVEDRDVDFQIGNQTWSFVLPAGWILISNPDPATGAVILARNQTASFVILQKLGADQVTKQALLAKAQEDFKTFTLLEDGDFQWTFQGKLKETDPERIFIQRLEGIADTNNYLYISCAYEAATNMKEQCDSIFSGWGSSVEGESEE